MKCKHVRVKFGTLSQRSLIESYGNESQDFCAKVVLLSMSFVDKFHHFINELKPMIRFKIAGDSLNDTQPWEDFQRRVT